MDEKIRPTQEWMEKWYDIMNQEVFGGRLGHCDLGIFTKGKGSNGRTLGWFRIQANGVKAERASRRMYVKDYWGDVDYVTEKNFASLCKPKIELNGNYKATEEALLHTLVHEMCHYYTYMRGMLPKQGHGPEFRSICQQVHYASNGRFTIQRLASAEEMKDWELDADIQQKNDERKQRKLSRTMVVVAVEKDKEVHMLKTTLDSLVNTMQKYHKGNIEFLGVCKDLDLVEWLTTHGYKQNMTTYRFWTITKQSTLDQLFAHTFVYRDGYKSTLQAALGIEDTTEKQQEPSQEEEYHLGYKIVKDGNGYNLEDKGKLRSFANPVKEISFNKEKNLFMFKNSKFTYEGTPGHWQKINESKRRTVDAIIAESINKMIAEMVKGDNDDENAISIDPNMNLGLASPFEYNQM